MNSTWQQNLTGVYHSSVVSGDLNSDNKTDLIVMGCTAGGADTCTTADKIRVYINNGTTLNENSTWESNLTSLGYGSLALGDIDNDGDLDLVALGDLGGGTGDVRIYVNNGTALDENSTWQSNLTNVDAYAGAVAFGDVDNDGDLDLALVGAIPSTDNGIYINNGTGFVRSSTWLASLPLVGHGLGSAALAFGDINNDEKLDLIFLGSSGVNFYRGIYINNGTSLVKNSIWESNIAAWGWPSLSIGDYDNDGDLDLVAMGVIVGDRCHLYNNNGTTFNLNETENTGMCGIFYGSLLWGDYDNDGDLDLTANGREGATYVHINNNTDLLIDTPETNNLENLQTGSSVLFVDLDIDYDLDLIETGENTTAQALVYISNRSETKPNNLPQPPNSSFLANYSSGSVAFGWGNGSDSETNTSGLYYNLRIGTSSNKNAIVTGIYGGGEDNGYFGNMMQRKNITITRDWDSNTTYFWSVQTIDTGLATSNWSEEQNFTTPIDTGLPNITLIAPDAGYYSDNISVLFNATVVDDAGIANVSIWADFDGTFKLNETNSSGKNDTSYVFKRNLSQGSYAWKYQAYDNSSSFNYANSSTRIVYVDLLAPVISLVSPTNGSSWTSSSTVTFQYSVSDLAIVNCSLILNEAIDHTNDSIIVDTTQTFSNILVNANYNWSVNCTDNVNRRNNSGTFDLTVSYIAPSGNGGNGGAGGGGAVTPVENVTNVTEVSEEIEGPQEEADEEEEEKGIEKIIREVVGLFEKTWIYLIVIGGVALVIVAYLVYAHKFRKWKRKEKRINWKPKKRWLEL